MILDLGKAVVAGRTDGGDHRALEALLRLGQIAQCRPQVRHMRRAVAISGVSAMIGTRGRSRATSEAVVPDWREAADRLDVGRLGNFARRRHDAVGDGLALAPTRLLSMTSR